MSSDIPLEIASTLQTASIQTRPDPRHDLNPSTAASRREPVTIAPFTSAKTRTSRHQAISKDQQPATNWNFNDDDITNNNGDDGIDYDDDDDDYSNEFDSRDAVAGRPKGGDYSSGRIPISAIQPVGRRKTMPPLPDLRFEQNYLKSIEAAASWRGVAWVTVRDQVCFYFYGVSFLLPPRIEFILHRLFYFHSLVLVAPAAQPQQLY